LFLTVLAATAAHLGAQSEEDCQRATKLHAEQELIQELFADLWKEAPYAWGRRPG